MHVTAAGVELDARLVHRRQPGGVGEHRFRPRRRPGPAVDVHQAVGVAERVGRAGETAGGELGGEDAACRRRPGVEALGPGAVAQVGHAPRGHAQRDAERGLDAGRVQARQPCDGGRGAEHAADGGRVQPLLVQLGRAEQLTETGHDLVAGHRAVQHRRRGRRGPGGAGGARRGRQQRGPDHGARVGARRLVSVVELDAVRADPVDQRRVPHRGGLAGAEDRAGPADRGSRASRATRAESAAAPVAATAR